MHREHGNKLPQKGCAALQSLRGEYSDPVSPSAPVENGYMNHGEKGNKLPLLTSHTVRANLGLGCPRLRRWKRKSRGVSIWAGDTPSRTRVIAARSQGTRRFATPIHDRPFAQGTALVFCVGHNWINCLHDEALVWFSRQRKDQPCSGH